MRQSEIQASMFEEIKEILNKINKKLDSNSKPISTTINNEEFITGLKATQVSINYAYTELAKEQKRILETLKDKKEVKHIHTLDLKSSKVFWLISTLGFLLSSSLAFNLFLLTKH
jgi:hypothetical protein